MQLEILIWAETYQNFDGKYASSPHHLALHALNWAHEHDQACLKILGSNTGCNVWYDERVGITIEYHECMNRKIECDHREHMNLFLSTGNLENPLNGTTIV